MSSTMKKLTYLGVKQITDKVQLLFRSFWLLNLYIRSLKLKREFHNFRPARQKSDSQRDFPQLSD